MTNPHPNPADQSAVLASLPGFAAPSHAPITSQIESQTESAAEHPAASPLPAALSTALEDEIHLLRARGLSDECIHGLLSGFNIDARPEPASHRWAFPLNDQLIRLIWGKVNPAKFQLD